MSTRKAETDFDTFMKVEMRVGTVVAVDESPARKPSYKLRIDFGAEVGERVSSVGVKPWYTPDQLLGRQVIAVVNFPPRQVATVMSEVLCLGSIADDGEVKLLAPDKPAKNGDLVG